MKIFKISCLAKIIQVKPRKKKKNLNSKLNFLFYKDCFPGSYFHNRSCYYFSKDYQKASWTNAEKLCKKLRFLNSSLLVIKSNEELNFIRQRLLFLKHDEEFSEQLVFSIGFNYTKGIQVINISINFKQTFF